MGEREIYAVYASLTGVDLMEGYQEESDLGNLYSEISKLNHISLKIPDNHT